MFSESKINIKMKTSLLILCMIITYTQARCTKQRSYSGDQAITTCKGNTYIPLKKDNEVKETPGEILAREVREFEKEMKAAELAGKPYRRQTFFIGGEDDAVVNKETEAVKPWNNYDKIDRGIQKPKTSGNNRTIKINQKEAEEDKELVLAREVREFKKEMKAAELAGKPYSRQTFFIGGEDDAAVKKESGGVKPCNNYDTIDRSIQKPITPLNNKSIKINQKEVEEDKELALAREVREFEKEMKAAELAGKPYRRQTFFIGGEDDAAVNKETEAVKPCNNYDKINRGIQKPKTSGNNRTIKINQKEVEEDKELALAREVREFKKEMKAAELAGKPYSRQTFFIGGEDDAAVKKETEAVKPWNKYDAIGKGIQKPKTTCNKKSTKKHRSNRKIASNNNKGRYAKRNVKPNGQTW